MSFPAIFFALSSVALIAALVAMWNSLRAAFGGGPRVAIETSRDLPDHAALNDEKASLLRAIKDLEYEHAVGKMGEADFQRLDAAYRARAKQVLAQLDRDVKPLYERAERLIAERISGVRTSPVKVDAPKRKPAPDTTANAPDRARSLDEIIAAIHAGEITEPPPPPADWPEQAKQFFVDAVRRAIDEARAKREVSSGPAVSSADAPRGIAASSADAPTKESASPATDASDAEPDR